MYLSASDIDNLEPQHKIHFLNDKAVRRNKSLGDVVGLANLGVHIVNIPPGALSTEFHVHHYEEEFIYVLSGTGVARIGEGTQRIGPGDFIGCPINGVAHDLRNDGDEELVCLVAGQRLERDVADYPDRKKRLYRNSGRWDLVDHEHIERIMR